MNKEGEGTTPPSLSSGCYSYIGFLLRVEGVEWIGVERGRERKRGFVMCLFFFQEPLINKLLNTFLGKRHFVIFKFTLKSINYFCIRKVGENNI